MKQDLDQLVAEIGYNFQDRSLLEHALRHSTYSNEHHMPKVMNNERLEFLGDAVLELSTSDFLYKQYKNKEEGELSKLRASIVCEPTLAITARDLNLGEYLYLGKGEDKTGGRNRDSILSDAVEALIGAIYLDGGFTNAKEFVNRFILNDVEHKQLFFDSKTILQEVVQERYTEPLSYAIMEESGPDHNKVFRVQAMIGTKGWGMGLGKSKKQAEQHAAYETILLLKKSE